MKFRGCHAGNMSIKCGKSTSSVQKLTTETSGCWIQFERTIWRLFLFPLLFFFLKSSCFKCLAADFNLLNLSWSLTDKLQLVTAIKSDADKLSLHVALIDVGPPLSPGAPLRGPPGPLGPGHGGLPSPAPGWTSSARWWPVSRRWPLSPARPWRAADRRTEALPWCVRACPASVRERPRGGAMRHHPVRNLILRVRAGRPELRLLMGPCQVPSRLTLLKAQRVGIISPHLLPACKCLLPQPYLCARTDMGA